MNKIILIICLLFFSNISYSIIGGDEVRNGGGIAENYLYFALENLGHSIQICLNSNYCSKDNESKIILQKINENLPQELAKNILYFSSEQKNPGMFIVDGVVRMAVTGNQVGDKIYYNLDLLYNRNEVHMSYGIATQSLIHELGHHIGVVDHSKLELIGAEVRKMLDGVVSEASFLPHLNSQGMSGVAIEKQSYIENGSLILLFKDNIVVLTDHFKSLIDQCNTPKEKIKNSSIQFFNIHWNHNGEIFKNIKLGILEDQFLSGNVVVYCSLEKGLVKTRLFKFDLKIGLDFTNKFNFKNSQLIEPPKFIIEYKGAIF